MKKLLTILLLTAALNSGAQNIWRAPSVFEQPVNFKAAISQTSGTDSLKITTAGATSSLTHGNGAVAISDTSVRIGINTATGYRLNTRTDKLEFQKGNTDSIVWTIANDTAHVVGNFSSWDFQPALPGAGWNLTGNAGTTAGTNFVGTTDRVDFLIKRNGYTTFKSWAGTGIDNITSIQDSLGHIRFATLSNANGTVDQVGLGTVIGSGTKFIVDLAINSIRFSSDSFIPQNDNVTAFGTAAKRLASVNSVTANFYGSVTIADGTQGAGKVLTSDATGLASWQTLDSLIIDSVATTGDTTQLVGNAFVAIIATGAITYLVLRFPSTPYDNMSVVAKFDYAITTLTADGNGATVYGFPASTVLGLYCKWVYNSATNSWY